MILEIGHGLFFNVITVIYAGGASLVYYKFALALTVLKTFLFSSTIRSVDNALLETEFVSWPMVRYKREVLFGWVDLLGESFHYKLMTLWNSL